MGQKEGKFTIGNNVSKVLCMLILHSNYTRALTSENVCVCMCVCVCARAAGLGQSNMAFCNDLEDINSV